MPQQVLAFLAGNAETWSVREMCAQLDMPESTVRGQLQRLMRRGLVRAEYSKADGCRLFWAI